MDPDTQRLNGEKAFSIKMTKAFSINLDQTKATVTQVNYLQTLKPRQTPAIKSTTATKTLDKTLLSTMVHQLPGCTGNLLVNN